MGHNLKSPKSSRPPSADSQARPSETSRRDFLLSAAKLGAMSIVGGAVISSSSGCVPAGAAHTPQLVWGRRGMSERRFLKPRAMAIDANDELYIVDTTGRIQVFSPEGELLRYWTTPETANGRPTGMSVLASHHSDGEPRLLVADTHYYRMLVYTLDGQLIEAEQIGGVAGHNPGEFAFVTDAVCDRHGCYYIGEYGDSDRIQKFDPYGQFMTQWGGTGREPEQFVRPQSLMIDGDTLWIADACNHRIQRYDISTPTPEFIDALGQEGSAPLQYYYPYDLALASDGSVIICEYGNQRLQRLGRDGEWIATWGGPGFQPGQLYQPWGVVIDSQQRVHVLDSNNHRVQRISMPS